MEIICVFLTTHTLLTKLAYHYSTVLSVETVFFGFWELSPST